MKNSMEDFRRQLRHHIEASGLTPEEAARQIGMTVQSLNRHLTDGYIRSDSEAKYRLWMRSEGGTPIQPQAQQPRLFRLEEVDHSSLTDQPLPIEFHADKWTPDGPLNVVDIFSGAGGLSLGFDLFQGGQVFRTVMALDVNEPMVRVFNDNHRQPAAGHYRVAREVDLSDFFNEAEVLAFYLDHYGHVHGDEKLLEALGQLAGIGLNGLVESITAVDLKFLSSLTRIRSTPDYMQAWQELDSNTLGQTSVQGFHSMLKLPMTAKGSPSLGALLWSGSHLDRISDADMPVVPDDLRQEVAGRLEKLWDEEFAQLISRREGTGRGQLASAGKKIASFIKFMQHGFAKEIREAWLTWRIARDSLRIHTFGNEAVWQELQQLYTGDRRVAVVVGGPPCQGFSRIGRGKIRSLREQSVHVQYDAQAGDRRNYLMHQYVLFIGALAPDVFVFENVRHFQAEVKMPEGTFSAPAVLQQAIQETSHEGLHYQVAHRILDATQHCIPQTRERFFMIGVAEKATPQHPEVQDAAAWTLQLPRQAAVNLMPALEGLPDPFPASTPRGGEGISAKISTSLERRPGHLPEDQFINWLRSAPPRGWPAEDVPVDQVDAHYARVPREDDRMFFELLGPGKRWMDYRADASPTVAALNEVLSALTTALREHQDELPGILKALDLQSVSFLRDSADGSLSLRLLLENIPPAPGELAHHLAKEGYLAKREGQHGDWLARMRADRPSKTMVSHMGKDTYAYVHPFKPRTVSVREAARIQTFPDWYRFGSVGLVDAFTVVGNAVPPLLSNQIAARVAQIFAANAVQNISLATATG
ncbi:DNA cytosine methyltransferase [Deinococcus cavernae]|uniref:DNA (cytosine-5-)-methyltransferase n=1 Tax=Deinococcus cavernae TaxID=2320857 RepID=A0A418VET1_9DEIO|nr:DNA cytosine methyltransferase [Deinococcus cavernae]RJF74619.1 DNA cytosine methyltransferase [Deinococcus cavernae]